MDHQWGDLQTERVGWDWFALQLDDGSEVMYSVVRDSAGTVFLRYGTYVDVGGRAETLGSDGVSIQPISEWLSPITGIKYPSGWRIAIERLALSAQLIPVIRDAEFHTFDRNTPPYWEGEVSVDGVREGSPIHGQGFVELVGYTP
jgi:predicted secreted hydrolase